VRPLRGRRPGRSARRALAGACALLAAGAAIAGCGGSGSTSASATSRTTSALRAQTSSASVVTSSAAVTSSISLAAHYKQLEAAMAAYASCMTSHGVSIAPPHRNSRGVPALGAPTSTSTSSPRFDSAIRACRQQALRALALDRG